MTTVTLWRAKGQQFFDNTGNELDGGTLEYDDAGTSNNQTVYSDSAGASSLGHTVTLDNNGRLETSIYVATVDFKETLKDSSGNTIFSEDNLPGASETAEQGFTKPIRQTNILTGASETVSSDDVSETFLADTSSNDIVANIPASSAIGAGKDLTFLKTSSSNVLSGVPASGNISDYTTKKLYRLGDWIRTLSDGANYFAIGGNAISKLPIGYYYLGGINNNTSDLSHDIDISPSEFKSDTNDYDIIINQTLTKQIDASWSEGNDAGGLDTGAATGDTWYYVYAILNPTTDTSDVLFSASSSSPTLPSGYTKKRLISALRTNSSGNLYTFLYVDGWYIRRTQVLDIDDTSGGTSEKTGTLSTSVPTGVSCLVDANIYHPASAGAYRIYHTSQDDQAISQTAAPLGSYDGDANYGKHQFITDENAQFHYRHATSFLFRVSVNKFKILGL